MSTFDTHAFHSALKQHFHGSRNATNAILQKAQDASWERFLALGLPSQKMETYRYIHLRPLLSRAFQMAPATALTAADVTPHIAPECTGPVLVFVNGHYQPQLSKMSSDRLVVAPLSQASRTYSSLLSNQWISGLQIENDPFAAINGALHHDGIFLYLPPKCEIKAPIQILNIIDTTADATLLTPRVYLFAGNQSQATILSTFAVRAGDDFCLNYAIDLAIEENADITYVQTHQGEISPTSWHFDALRAQLKRNSRLKTISLVEGGPTTRYDYRVALAGENAEAQLNGLWMLSGKGEAHANVLMDHQAPHCRSMQLYKGVLNDFSRSSFEGKILVQQAAQKTEAFQLNNNLLLSDRAQSNSKPNLEIFADDVKASHGATVGQLDAEQLFYMKARGFSEADAKNLLVYSFCQEVIDLIPIPSVMSTIQSRAKRCESTRN